MWGWFLSPIEAEMLAKATAKRFEQEAYNLKYGKGSFWFRTKEGVEYKVNDEFIGIKMTREEAILKFQKSQIQNATKTTPIFTTERGYAEAYIKGMEAIGLLKFEEEKELSKEIPSPSTIIADTTRNNFINGQFYLFADKCVNALYAAGYKIVHKSVDKSS